MKKQQIIILVVGVLILALVASTGFFSNKNKIVTENSPKNATYMIDGKEVTLVNGVSETEAAPGSASKIITTYFGNDVTHDFNADGRPDTAFILTQTTGGSGTFYYVVAALNTPEGYKGSDAVLLGDRIAPQTTEMGKGNIIIVNYADRKFGEDFSVSPSVGKSIWLLLDPTTMQFGQVEPNFEGEADPSVMRLDMKTWEWVTTTLNDDTTFVPGAGKRFTLTFNAGGRFSATTDCNGIGGEYVADNEHITFSNMVSTLMYCEGSQEGEFAKQLGQVETYHFTSDGKLILDIKFDSGAMIFR